MAEVGITSSFERVSAVVLTVAICIGKLVRFVGGDLLMEFGRHIAYLMADELATAGDKYYVP